MSNDQPNSIVARVNGEAITASELGRAIVDIKELHKIQGSSADQQRPDNVKVEALRSLIVRRLLLEESERRGMRVSDGQLDAAIIELRGRFLDLEDFGDWMTERGFDDRSLMESIARDILVTRVKDELTASVEVSERQIADYFSANASRIEIGEAVRLGIVIVYSAASSSEVLSALRNGAPFDDVAEAWSIAPDAYTDWIPVVELPPPLRGAIENLSIGDVYGPVVRDNNEHLIVGLAARRPIMASSLDEARESIRQRLRPVLVKQALSKWLSSSEARANIEYLLNVESDSAR